MEHLRAKILKSFKGLTFVDETHTYYLNGNPLETSVSGVIKNFVREVDFDSIALATDRRDNLPPGTTRQLWNNKSSLACMLGDKIHFFGEIYAFHRIIKPADNYEVAVQNFWEDLPKHIVPIFVELKMYHKVRLFGGMGDIILYNTKTGKFIIADYKTNADLFSNYKGKTLLAPFSNLLENDFNKYQIQFSLYQILFEQTGLEVERRILIHVKKDGTYDMYDTEDLTDTLKNYLHET